MKRKRFLIRMSQFVSEITLLLRIFLIAEKNLGDQKQAEDARLASLAMRRNRKNLTALS